MILKSKDFGCYLYDESEFASGFGTTKYECKHSTGSDSGLKIDLAPDIDLGDDFWTETRTVELQGPNIRDFQNRLIKTDHISKATIRTLVPTDLSIIGKMINLETGVVEQKGVCFGFYSSDFKYEMFGAIPLKYSIEVDSNNPFVVSNILFGGFKIKKDPSNIIPQINQNNFTYLRTPDVKIDFNGSELKIDKLKFEFSISHDDYFHQGGVVTIPKRKNIKISFISHDYDHSVYQDGGTEGSFSIMFGLKIFSINSVKLKPLKKPFSGTNSETLTHEVVSIPKMAEVTFT